LKYTGINGSKGAFGRNELSLNLRKLDFLYPKTEAISLAAKAWNYTLNEARNLSPYIFYDTGLTRAVTAISQDLKTEYITGTGAGIRYNGKYLRAGIAYARSLRAPDYILAQNNYSKSAVYFSAAGQVWF
jgi:hemolysin activation/secretion protein